MRLRKARYRSGFTLAETLLAVLIMLMVSSIMVTGIPAARNAYEKVVLGANAEVLLSTSLTALREELGTARNIDIKGTKEISYYSAKTHAKARIYLSSEGTDPQTIWVEDYIIVDQGGTSKEGFMYPLVSRKSSSDVLYVRYDNVRRDHEGKYVIFENVGVYRMSGTNPLTSADLYIRTLADEETV